MWASFITSGFRLSVCLSVCILSVTPHFLEFSLVDLSRRLLAKSTSSTKFVYIENEYYESSIRGAP